jgi:hypothetical protein
MNGALVFYLAACLIDCQLMTAHIISVLNDAWGAIVEFFTSQLIVQWATFAAEIAVASVIYLELEHERQKHFLEKVTASEDS